MRARPRLYLADNLWLIGHDERSGKSHVSDHALGLGLAGSLLGELVLHARLELTPEHDLHVVNKTGPPEQLASELLQMIITEQTRPREERVTRVRDWLLYLSGFAESWVTARLLDVGMIQPFRTRKIMKSVTMYRVVDINDSLSPAIGITSRLGTRQPLKEYDIAFAGFALATGLERRMMQDTDEAGRAYLHDRIAGLLTSLRSLVAETESAVGDAVLTHRT